MVLNTNKEHKNIFLSQTHQFFNTCKSYCDGIIINRKIIMYKLNDLKNPIYQNDTTLFINPAKKIYESKKIKLISSLIFFFFIFFQILSYSAFAEENQSSWELWHDEDYEFTYIDSWGSINKADLMTLTINNNNCDTLSVNFFINSHDRERAENGKKFTLEITETPHDGENWQEYKSEIYVNYSEIINDNIVYVLAFDHEFETRDWIDRLEEFDPFYFYLSINENSDEQIDPSRYFEHTDNLWDMKNLKNVLKEAYRNCRLKTYHETIV